MFLSDNLKSALYTGIGMALKGKEKVEELAKEIVKDNNMAAEEGEKFVKETVKKAGEAKEEMEDFIEKSVKNTISKLGLVTKNEYDALKKELDELKSKQQ